MFQQARHIQGLYFVYLFKNSDPFLPPVSVPARSFVSTGGAGKGLNNSLTFKQVLTDGMPVASCFSILEDYIKMTFHRFVPDGLTYAKASFHLLRAY